MRVRITFAKTEAMRFTSHLDLHRAWERTLRRAKLPLSYSQGFNPRPRLHLASALPLGFTSQGEVLDVRLDETLPIGDIEEALLKALPPGIEVSKISIIEGKEPSLQSQLLAAEFVITIIEPQPQLYTRCQEILDMKDIPRTRRGKAYDLRPLILALELIPEDEEGCQRIFARMKASEGATGRPEELLHTLEITPEETRVHRTRLIFQDVDNIEGIS